MRFPSALLSLVEQLFSSAFTFFVFVVATRMLASEELALYAAFFSLNQSFSFFLMGLVLFPVASSTGTEVGKQLGISIVLLLVLLAAFAMIAPLVMRIFDSFDGRIDATSWTVAVMFFTSQCLYETTRWLSIRMLGASATLPLTVARFVLFFGTLLYLGSDRLDGTAFALIQVLTNLASSMGYGLRLRKLLSGIEPQLPDRSALRHVATFGNSLATFGTNFAALTLIDKAWGGAGLAAFHAMRSATNPIGLISQVIDNHFSADLARAGQRFAFGSRRVAAALAGSMALVALAVPLAPWVTALVLGERFGEWWPLFPAMLFASLAHAITRPIFVNWRLAGDSRELNLYSALLILGVLPAMLMLWWMGAMTAMVLLFAAQPMVCILLLVFCRRSKQGAVAPFP